MLTFEDIKSQIESFSLQPSENDKNDIRVVADQLGFTVPDCKCRDKFTDLVVKLKLWLKNHPDGFCHYEMKRGIVRRYADGTNVYQLNLTDEKAKWLLENDEEAPNYLKKILDDNDSNEPATAEGTERSQIVEAVQQTEKPKRSRKKKIVED